MSSQPTNHETAVKTHETAVKDVECCRKQTLVPDGGWGWVVCIASSTICFIVVSVTHSFGIFLIGLRRIFDDPVSTLSLIGALLTGLSMLAAPVASILLVYFSHRTVMISAGVLGFTGAILGAFSTNIEMMITTYGIITGASLGISYFTCQIITGLYFDKKRALAIGINNCGGGIGTMVSSLVVDYFLDVYGLRGTLLLISGILLNITVFGALCRPLPFTYTDGINTEYIDGTSLHSAITSPSSTSDSNSKTKNDEDKILKETLDGFGDVENTKSLLAANENGIKEESIIKNQEVDRSSILKRCSNIIGIELFRNTNFVLLIICYALFATTVIMTTYIPAMCVWSFGMKQNTSAILVSIMGLFAVISQLLFGVFMDLLHITSTKIFIFSLLTISGVSITIPHCEKFQYAAPLVCLLGFSLGLIISLRLVLTTEIAGLEKSTKGYSILSFMCGISYFASAPIFGLVFDTTNSFLAVFYGGGACALIALILFLLIICRDTCHRKCLLK